MFFFSLFLPPHTPQLYIKECIFSVTPLHSWQVATAWEDSLSCRAMQAAGAHVWLGCQWITLYGERKLKIQGCNLLVSGTDLKAFFFPLAALLEVFQICHSWVWTELRCTGNNKPRQSCQLSLPYPPPSITSWQRRDHAKVSLHEIQMLDMPNWFRISSKMQLYAIMRTAKVFPSAVRLCVYYLPACQSDDWCREQHFSVIGLTVSMCCLLVVAVGGSLVWRR